MNKEEGTVYDLEDRLLNYGAAIINLTRKLIQRAKMLPQATDISALLNETDELIRIFVTSIATAEKRRK